MKIFKSYKTELDPNNKQRSSLLQHAGAVRYVYNWGLEQAKAAFDSHESVPRFYELSKRLTCYKKNHLWLYDVSKWVTQEALKNLDAAFRNFYRKWKLKKIGKFSGKLGFPRFKSRNKAIGSFTLRGDIHIYDDSIKLPKIGVLRLKEKHYIPIADEKIRYVVVEENAGRWYVVVVMEEEVLESINYKEGIVGVDLGVKTLATVSDGTVYENPRVLRKYLKKLNRLKQSIRRKSKTSNNRKKERNRYAKLHRRIKNIRGDVIHKMTTALTRTKSCICIEDLNVSGMKRNRFMCNAISDASLATICRQFYYKGIKNNCRIVTAGRFYPSTKTCNVCGYINENLTLKDRSWVCVCGENHDRDFNASKNLEKVAVSSPDTKTACGGDLFVSEETGIKHEQSVQ